MSPEPNYHFDDFLLDVENRQLLRNGEPVDLNARYFNALVLLVRNTGQLVEKETFFSDVWDGVLVSDAALTQCIKDIRRQLGDDAAKPRYIQTVPRYGYRFIAPVQHSRHSADEQENGKPVITNKSSESKQEPDTAYPQLRRVFIEGGGGTLGGITAGLLGGLFYGLAIAYAPGTDPSAEMGAASMLLVLVSLNVIVGGMGGLGVSFGMAAASLSTGRKKIWRVAGGALGGLVVGGLVKLLGVDAFNLLFGTAPAGITGGLEGAVLGAAVAFGATFGNDLNTSRRFHPVTASAISGGVAGVLISIAGGRLMSGSLELLTQSFTSSKLRIDTLGYYFGETHFGYLTHTILSGMEGLLFGACVAGGIIYLRRFWDLSDTKP